MCDGSLLSLPAPKAGAFSQAQLNQLELTNSCPGCDLSGVNLGFGVHLTATNLQGANLTGAILGGVLWTDGRTCQSSSIGVCK